ncbi:SDR family NAD(P)-dependent oxidoreductase [Paenibacillus glycanilyticus]|uniref:SDR family NAD(P)-dependent oxidoreductase n=1 Tax=Paenibacillus glycanilyticus TaxID=126569 RepID=UPI002040753F|nr:SDR family NAD(P)-dependent oxidoreductase [Paenibacillus glycanilyticus]MCM3628672.1 SDR family NAD(P)-dependent oxidoreductase [Paenibacillus glycanilyticus]
MSNHVYIITGVSSGLGESLAKQLLTDGNTVIGLSRTNNESIGPFAINGKYKFYTVDLTMTDKLSKVLQEIMTTIDSNRLESITLINNAATVTPLTEIQHCSDDEIVKSIQLNVAAPMVLTAAFARLTSDWRVSRKIVNISSGSGKYPAPSMSLYCSSKAAINMFSRCIGMEQETVPDAIQVFAIDPGMMDTPMQRTARESDMALSAYFASQKEEGNLVDPARTAQQIIELISSPASNNGGVHQVH